MVRVATTGGGWRLLVGGCGRGTMAGMRVWKLLDAGEKLQSVDARGNCGVDVWKEEEDGQQAAQNEEGRGWAAQNEA